jgi:type II secretory pathway pseudopilin PulG
MKRTLTKKFSETGFTLAEMAVAVGVLGLLGAVFFTVLKSGLTLSAKNTAVNVAHQEAREGILKMTRDIHAAISVPQLRNNTHDASYTFAASFPVVSSTPASPLTPVSPTAPGVSFQNIASGPNYVWKDPGAANLIMIKDNPNKPVEGMRLIVPFWGLEEDITKVTASGSSNHSNVFIKADQSTPSIDAPAVGGTYAITYYTDRAAYIVMNGQYVVDSEGPFKLSGGAYVPAGTYIASASGAYILSNGIYMPYSSGSMQRYDYTVSGSPTRYRYENGELHMFKQRYSGGTLIWQDMATVAKYISSPTPFYVPLNSGGTPDLKYVGVQLTARDPKSTNQGYLATASLLNTQIDYRSRLTNTQ